MGDPIAINFETAEVMVELKNSPELPMFSEAEVHPYVPGKYIQRIEEHVDLAK